MNVPKTPVRMGQHAPTLKEAMLDYTPKSTTNYSKLLTLLIRVGGVFRHLAITSSWLEPVLFDIILTSSSSLHSPPLEKDVVLNMNG